jgi:exopolysaccharide production protein ExoQ
VSPSVATIVCAFGIAGLFYLARDRTIRTSKALWIPVIYLWIIGSRPVSAWLGIAPADGTNVQLEGSPLDAAIFGLLLISAIVVLVRRGKRTLALTAPNWALLLYFLYCLISVAWSSHPDVALKRWIKAIGDPAMCLIIVTDTQPVAALKRVISRIGILLFPTSVLLIKYYVALGRGYTPDGLQMNTGVTTFKNLLGVLVLVVSLGTVWHLLGLLRAKTLPSRRRYLLAQGTLLGLGVWLFILADSQTSIACFILGCALIIASELRAIRGRASRMHVLCLLIFLAAGATLLLGGGSDVAQAMGRKSNLSGRTDIWAAAIGAVPNGILGAGFESFWISSNVLTFQQTLAREGWWDAKGLNEAHNGYLEVYLNLGLVGVSLITLILVRGYKRAVDACKRSPSIGGLMLAYVIVSAVYSVTEAGFRPLSLIWCFLLLSLFTTSGVRDGLFDSEEPRKLASRRIVSRRPAFAELVHARHAVGGHRRLHMN